MQTKNYPRIYSIALLFIAIFFFATPLQAEISVDKISLNKIDIETLDSPDQLSSFLEDVYQAALDKGIPNFIPYSLLLIKESKKALGQKEYEKAEILTRYARKISPDLPAVYTAQALAQWSGNKVLIHKPFIGYVKASLAKFRELESLASFVSANLPVVAGSFLIAIFLFSAISMIKYFRLGIHDLQHQLTSLVPDAALLGFLLILFLLPLFFNVTIFWTACFWLLLLFGYQNNRERIVTTVLVFVFALMPLFSLATSYSLFVPRSDIIRLMWNANYGFSSQKDIKSIEDLSREYPDDEDVFFSLGLLYKKDGRYKRAQAYYERAIEINPNNYKAHINIGNVYFARKQSQKAIEKYKEAASLAPSENAASHFNLSRAYQLKFQFNETDKELLRAKEIDRKKINYYLKIYSENYNRLLIDETISKRRLLEKGFALFNSDGVLKNEIWNSLFMGIPLNYGLPVVLGLLIFTFYILKKETLRIAKTCTLCGKSICRRCQGIITDDVRCIQCTNFFKKQEHIDRRVKKETSAMIKRHLSRQRIMGMIISLLFPGAGHVWKRQPIKGIIYILLFYFLLLKAISLIVFYDIYSLAFSSSQKGVIVFLVFLLLFWFVLVLSGLKLRDKKVDDLVKDF